MATATRTTGTAGRAVVLAAATPATRERYVDLLRAVSICVVVLGHWLIAVVVWRAGEASGQNALALVPGLWVATWVLQVMPVFFFVGGFSNLTSYDSVRRRGGGYAAFIRGRFARLLRPTVVFVAVWLVAARIADAAGLPERWATPMTRLVAQPLWFLGVYLIAVALAPAMIRLHRRFGARAVIALGAGAVAVDVARFSSGVKLIGYLNFAFVWLFAHQLGFLYADGTLPRLPRRAFAATAAAGLAALAGLTLSGSYPGSMVGLPGDRVSNMDPPTVAILALTVWLVGLAMLLRERASAWLARPRAWTAVVAVNGVIMTAFLWHLTAMLAAIAVLYPLGFPQPDAGTAAWWALRPAWIAGLAAALAPLALAFGRFERPGAGAPPAPGAAGTALTAIGAAAVGLGVLGFAVSGFSPGGHGRLVALPMTTTSAALALGAGLVMLRAAGARRST